MKQKFADFNSATIDINTTVPRCQIANLLSKIYFRALTFKENVIFVIAFTRSESSECKVFHVRIATRLNGTETLIRATRV